MIDLHSHILPGIDDGAGSLDIAIEMAKMAVADGIEVMACTPHFMPGMYDNTSGDVRRRVAELNSELMDRDIELALVVGSDAHMRPDFLSCLRSGDILTLHDSQYVLFEPPHNIMPQRLEDLLFNISVSGYTPVLTHPERLKWIEHSYPVMQQLAKSGIWMQITSGSLTGRFGKRPQYWAQKMLAEGLVSILATDAHNTRSRPPLLAEGYEIAKSELGREQALHLVSTRPECVLENLTTDNVPPLPMSSLPVREGSTMLRRIFEVFT
jgi:protein-tyrosine phosphatase